ncbi:MAG: hypothetical protein GX081_09910 [Firmicutes bacterium]|nr:hypothetical protein [Bacillota bacterium]
MRKPLIAFFLIIIMAGSASPAFAVNLDLYGSVAAHHEYTRLNGASKEYAYYLLINTKARTTGDAATFAYLDLDWRFPAAFIHQANEKETWDGVVNEAYLNIPLLDHLVLTIGKKRFLSGVGFAYNPVDFIDAPPNPFRPDLKQGVYSWGLTYFRPRYALDTLLVMADHPENYGYGLKLSTFSFLAQTDLSFIGFYAKKDGLSLGLSVESTPFSAPFWRDLAFYGEAGLVQSSLYQPKLNGSNFYHQLLAGIRYIDPATETSAVFEYYFLSDGLGPKERKEILQRQPLLNLPGRSARHNLLLHLQRTGITRNKHPFTDSLSLSIRALGNLEDQSKLITASITSEVLKNTPISLESTWYLGDKTTEYGSIPIKQAYSLLVRVDF